MIPTAQPQSSDISSGSGSAGKEMPTSCEISDGDKAFGIQVVTDVACAAGGLGCYNDHCRYCKVIDTLKSAHLESCETLGALFPSIAPLTVSTGACIVSSGDAAVGVGGMTDPLCLYGGIGCFNDHCRFCQSKPTPQSSHFVLCSWAEDSSSGSDSLEGSAGDAGSDRHLATESTEATPAEIAGACTMKASDGDVAVGINIITDATCASGGSGCIDNICRLCKTEDTTQSASFNFCPAGVSKTCSTTVSAGDAAVGINIITDASCAQGGLGCIDSVCRFCQTTTTPQSTAFVACASIGTTTTQTPVTSATTPSITACTIAAAAGDIAAGINIVTDKSCVSGGLGCIDSVCRFCRISTSSLSSAYVDCAVITGTTTQTSTPGPTPASTPPTKANTPSIVFDCFRTISGGDKAVGLDIASDIRCSEGGAGCLDEVCRYCKRFDTVQSQSYIDCSTIPSSNIGSDITFVSIPLVTDSDTPERMLEEDSFGSTDDSYSTDASNASDKSYEGAATCVMTVSSGDAAVGINIVTDTSCSSGGTGCVDSVCRYCKTKDTEQSAHLSSCPSTTTAPTAITKTCPTTVSDGDASVGINIITDTSCANGGLGCIDSICRYCKTKLTDQSAHFGSCSDYSSTSISSPPATVAPVTTPTSTSPIYSIPVDCYQTASNGDKSLGLDIVTDMRCGDGGVGCLDSICRFCKRFETPQSYSYMSCSDIRTTHWNLPRRNG
ncbi:hypothetical protein GN244_ATG03862 [Phytophthora infestans]|uniref:Uncharacterized protein n=1 Tax=Phytophthora infestans TaxID=4787 RepID=A0A833WNL9_PHYIN|nr:hypothetical protein GN244_ATG03862 [Phytophthora infestans]